MCTALPSKKSRTGAGRHRRWGTGTTRPSSSLESTPRCPRRQSSISFGNVNDPPDRLGAHRLIAHIRLREVKRP